jgi:hypothetical protein
MVMDATVWAIEQRIPLRLCGFGVDYDEDERRWTRVNVAITPFEAVLLQHQPTPLRWSESAIQTIADVLDIWADWVDGFADALIWSSRDLGFSTPHGQGLAAGLAVQRWLEEARAVVRHH